MKKGLWHKRIPTFSAFAILFVSIFVTSFILQKSSNFIGKASPDRTPQNVTLSNITDSSFTVSFVTYDKTASGVQVISDAQNTQTFFDVRTKNVQDESFYSHYITVTNLTAGKLYEFSLLSGGEVYNDGNKKYKVTTAPKISGTTSSLTPISGRVLLPDGTAGSDVIVLVDIPGGQTLSQITGNDGTYKVNTNSLRTTDLSNFLKIDLKSLIQLRFMRQNLESSIKSVFSESSFLPTTTLSYKYDFSNIEDVETETLPSELKVSIPGLTNGDVKILNPKPGQSFIDQRPLFQGGSGPKQKVNITIESTPIKASVTADSNGFWTYRPTTPLEPDTYKITVQSVDSLGIFKTVTATFSVFAQGSQIAQSGPTVSPTPRVTAAPTPTPIRTPTPKPTSAPTATPTLAPTGIPVSLTPIATPTNIPPPTLAIPSATPTNIPTATKAPTPTPHLAATTPVPPGGVGGTAIAIVSVVLIISGGVFLLLL